MSQEILLLIVQEENAINLVNKCLAHSHSLIVQSAIGSMIILQLTTEPQRSRKDKSYQGISTQRRKDAKKHKEVAGTRFSTET